MNLWLMVTQTIVCPSLWWLYVCLFVCLNTSLVFRSPHYLSTSRRFSSRLLLWLESFHWFSLALISNRSLTLGGRWPLKSPSTLNLLRSPKTWTAVDEIMEFLASTYPLMKPVYIHLVPSLCPMESRGVTKYAVLHQRVDVTWHSSWLVAMSR